MLEIYNNAWWINAIAPMLEESKFEVKVNPTENENCVILVLKEEYRLTQKKKNHYLAVKSYVNGGFSTWMKKSLYEETIKDYICPTPTRWHSNMPHFNNQSDTQFIFNIVKTLVAKQTIFE